ncbi:MAG: type II secretion system protein [Candidatus Omnitrophota bacterium]|nr:type II secretion system protein [Candidatus Omnitrophota bacterium]
MRKRITQIRRGFTLIELLIVIVLFSAGAVSLLQIFSMTIYGGSENQNTLIATALAEEKLEQIRNTAYGSVVDEARAVVPNYTFFEREVVVDDNTPVTNMKQVTVKVYWIERPGDVTISLVTYVSSI